MRLLRSEVVWHEYDQPAVLSSGEISIPHKYSKAQCNSKQLLACSCVLGTRGCLSHPESAAVAGCPPSLVCEPPPGLGSLPSSGCAADEELPRDSHQQCYNAAAPVCLDNLPRPAKLQICDSALQMTPWLCHQVRLCPLSGHSLHE